MHFRAGRKAQNNVSIYDPIDKDKDGNNLTLNDVVADSFALEEAYETQEEISKLHKVLETLQGRERQIILLRYGLSGQPALTQQQVADLLNISRSYVSRIEKKAIGQMRGAFADAQAQ